MLAITHRLRAALHRTWSAVPWQGWVLLAVLYGAVVALTVATYVEWISDSRFYLAWAYRYLGYPEAEAARLTRDYLIGMDGVITCNFCWPADYEYSFFHGESGAVSGPRLMYPLLSAPFVGLFGPPGMLVVPLLSYAVAVVALATLAARLWGRWWGVAASVLILLPAIASRFASFAMTDALALMFNVLLLLFLPLKRKVRGSDLLWFLVILALGLFTRQFAVTVTAGVCAAWLLVWIRDRTFKNQWLWFAFGSAALTAVVLKIQDYVAARLLDGDALSLTARYQRLTLEKFGVDGLASIPLVLRQMVRVDYDFARRLDRLLIVVLVVACGACILRFRSEISALLVGMSVPTLALAVIIVDPTYFRYFVPLVPLMALSVLALLSDLFTRPARSPFRSTEAATEGSGPGWPATRTRQVLAWTLLAGVHFLMMYLVIHRGSGYSILGVLLFTVAVPAIVMLAWRRTGPLAGALSGLLLVLSPTMVAQAISRLTEGAAMLAVVGCLAILPYGSVTQRNRGRAWAAFALTLGLALALSYRAVVFALAVVVAWLLGYLFRRHRPNGWTPFGLISLGLGLCALAADLLVPARDAPYRSGLGFQFFGDQWLLQLSRDRVLYATLLLTIGALMFWRPSAWRRIAIGMVGLGVAFLLFGGSGVRLGNLFLAYPAMVLLVAEMVNGLVLGEGSGQRSTPERPPRGEQVENRAQPITMPHDVRSMGALSTTP